jgi:hypothetical protein
MPVPAEWIEHRRGSDRELLGWIVPESGGYVAIDLMGRRVTEIREWLDAEEALEQAGIGYLADSYELLLDGDGGGDGHGDSDRWLQARIVEVSTESIRVKKEDGGAIDAPAVEYVLPFPAGARLRLRSGERELPGFGRRLG